MANNIYSGEESWKEKIDEKLWKKIESANADEKIPVWLWFVDIDQREIDEQAGKIQALKRRLLPDGKLILFGSQARGDARAETDRFVTKNLPNTRNLLSRRTEYIIFLAGHT